MTSSQLLTRVSKAGESRAQVVERNVTGGERDRWRVRRVEAPVDQAQECFGGQIECARHRLIGERVEFDGVMNGEKEVTVGRRRVNVYIEDTALRLACVRNELCQGVDQQRYRIGRDLCGRVERECDVPAVHRRLRDANSSQ